jgi:hypothetical protein
VKKITPPQNIKKKGKKREIGLITKNIQKKRPPLKIADKNAKTP